MKIIKLVAENVKGLKAVEIFPDENLQVISGKNGQGKSSIMDSIWLALAGGNASKSTERPIRDGEENAMAMLDMGDFIVKRKWTSNSKSTLQVTSKDGAKYASPQKLLDEMIGKLSFDPLAFSNLNTKDQLKTLLEIVDIDPTSIEEEKKSTFEERTIINREVKSLKTQLESIPDVDSDVPTNEVQSSSILSEMQQAQMEINRNNKVRQELNNLRQEYKNMKLELDYEDGEIKRLEEKLEKMKSDRQEKYEKALKVCEKGTETAKMVEKLSDPNLEAFHHKLTQVDEINKQVRVRLRKNEVREKYEEKLQESMNLTTKIEDLQEKSNALMKEANFPIDGLSFDESGVLYHGVPFKQCSSGERLKISTAMAMALNPKLRVIRIMDGSLLDSTNLKMIQEMAKEKDFQIWVEQVDESGTVGIVIEDGEVKKMEVA